MEEMTISEFDEASVRALSVRCALESLCRSDEPFTMAGLIDMALEIELYIDGGGSIRIECIDPKAKRAAGG